jgi:hypothetical protein
MRRVFLLVAAIIALLSVAVTAFVWVNDLVDSIFGYRSPLRGTPTHTEGTHRPLVSQVVLVLIDGLRYDTSLQMPHLNALRQSGAHAKLTAEPPSNAQTAWTAIVSGAGPELNGAPLFDHSLEWVQPIAVDHLFAAIRRAGLESGISGPRHWEKLVTPELLYTRYFADDPAAAADERVVDNALVFLREFDPAFLLVHLQQLDAAGRMHGGKSEEYRRAALRCDEFVSILSANVDMRRSAVVIVSSFGHLDGGGHGGDEAVTLITPFVMAGRNILPGDYGEISQTDLAPTIAALLGTPVPSGAQGRMQLDMLTMNAVDRAEKLVSLAGQRVRLASMYRYSIGQGPLGETAEGDMLVALSSLQVKNYESAAELGSLSVQEADKEMAQARRARIWEERAQRLAPLSALVLILAWVLWGGRSTELAWSTLAAASAAALYHVLFLRQGYVYSFSRTPAEGLAATLEPSIRRATIALSMGALVVLWRTWCERERSALVVVLRTYGYAALQLYFTGLLVGACAWWNGLHFGWYIPSFTVGYVHFAALMQTMLIAALAIPMPIAVAILQRSLLLITDRYSATVKRAQHAARSR